MVTVKTFNGFEINDGSDYTALGINLFTPGTADNVFLDNTDSDPDDAGTFALNVASHSLVVTIHNYANRANLAAELRQALRPGTAGDLVISITGVDYFKACRVQSLVQDATYPNQYTIVLQAAKTAWRAVTAETDDATLTESDTITLSVGGKSPTRLKVTLTPTAGQSLMFDHQTIYQLPGVKGVNWGRRAWCLTIDTAALVTAGKCRADCYDLRVIVDGQEMPRWIADANTDHTHVWFVLDIGPGYELDLLTPVASSGDIPSLVFKNTKNNQTTLAAMPSSGILMHGTEWMQYSGRDPASKKAYITQRGVLNTTLQAHSAGNVFQFVQHVIHVIYGKATATDPSLEDDHYDDEKPLFDLSASNNSQWIYTASTPYYDLNSTIRQGSWTPVLKRVGDLSENYLIEQNADSGDAAMGMQMASWQRAGKWQLESGYMGWRLFSPGGIYRISYTGAKYRNSAGYPKIAALQKSTNGSKWANVQSNAKPTAVSTWETITQTNLAISGYAWAQFILSGSLAAAADAIAALEVLTLTVEFPSAKIPTGTYFSETSNYSMDVTITNQRNGDSLAFVCPMVLNKVVVIDAEEFAVTCDGVNAHNSMQLNDEGRAEWMRLEPGDNDIDVAGADLGTLDVDFEWYVRRV